MNNLQNMASSSDDSDGGERVRNLHSVLVKSKGSFNDNEVEDDYAYKRKPGDLIFDACFEGGNLGHVEIIDRYEYDLMVRPDVSNPHNCIWFNFKVSNQRLNQCVIFTFVNLSENLKLFIHGLCPVIRTSKRPNWFHLNEDQVFYYKSRNHDRYVLSIAIRFSFQDDEHQLAMFYPYVYSNLSSFLNSWTVFLLRQDSNQPSIQSKDYVPNMSQCSKIRRSPELRTHSKVTSDDDQLRTRSSLETRKKTDINELLSPLRPEMIIQHIALSALYKPIPLVTIRSSMINSDNPRVIVIARLRGNLSSAASYVCQGMMDYILSDALVASVARRYIDFFFFPMLDPDSIDVGNSCSDLLGQQQISEELLSANPSAYSNISSVRNSINELRQNGRSIVIELEVNLHLIGNRIIGTRYLDDLRMERHLLLPKLLGQFMEDFYIEASRFQLVTDCIWLDNKELEISPFGAYQRKLGGRNYRKFDIERYLTMGKAIIYASIELLKPSKADMPDYVLRILDSFHHHSDDIDSLILSDLSTR